MAGREGKKEDVTFKWPSRKVCVSPLNVSQMTGPVYMFRLDTVIELKGNLE